MVCIEWIMNKPQTPQTGDMMDLCFCNDINVNYCAGSTCDKIRLDTSDACSGTTDDDDSFRRRNLQECEERISVGAVRCHCDKEFKESRLFCPSWTCQDYSTGDEVKETYECLTASANGLYCQVRRGAFLFFFPHEGGNYGSFREGFSRLRLRVEAP